MAYLIPSSLFIACLIMAAGTFLLYNKLTAGWAFIAASLIVMALSFTAFFRFQNKLRASGHFGNADKQETVMAGSSDKKQVS